MALDDANHSPARQRWTLILASVASFMVGLDVLVITTALPTLHQELNAGTAALGWTINAYEIGFAALILTGAALGDRYGRRLWFLIGVAIFTVGSVWCALSSSIGMLVAARALQGIGGGIATALALAVIAAATPPARRGAAFGIWGAITGLAVAVGPLVGGAVIEGFDWQWIFWINVPVGLLLIGLSRSKITESRGQAQPVDLLGLVLSTAGVVVLAHALIRAGDIGWTRPSVLIGLVAGVVLLVSFLLWQRRAAAPMMPLGIFRNLSLAGGSGASFALGAALYGGGFLLAQYLQLALGYDPLEVGIRLLPWVALAPLVSPIAGRVADRIGERPLVALGLFLFAVGFLLIGLRADVQDGYGRILVPLFIAGVGVATAFPTIASAVMRSVEPAHVGIASGVSNTSRHVGAVFGVAVAAAVFATFGGYRSPQDFVDGFGPALVVLAVITLIGLVPALIIRPPRAETTGVDRQREADAMRG
ncbi:DHA2 family efflux MFS transporter permease subunit [Micromonospora sp. NPDC049374]|uniref:DHA2 family efflux MFS transporter permease subunit n=1 Tax=unclassified Micromonospora TaxID=2617518 RepID=UPI003425FF1F